ncbi:MAG: GTP-binding protein gtr1 [Geoglossum umbratile]|nr:MAG: GTP-binding protein gtr1 [Geoglossum umbratile]
MDIIEKKGKKKKVLLMGKSGSGKSSMRSIVFSNYVAKDTRRLGATIDVEHSHVKFLGNLTLNLWDCGGQDAFMENYLQHQRDHVFANVAVLIYVFDIESREFDRDLVTYSAVARALSENSSGARIFCLIHKMDLVQAEYRQKLFEERSSLLKERSEGFDIIVFATSIWDETLYKAWASIIYTLIPNLSIIETYLRRFAEIIEAEEVVLFERTTFLVVCHVSQQGLGNPNDDRFERISNIIKTFKQSLSRFTSSPKSAPQFTEIELRAPRFSLFIDRLTSNTYILVVVKPGESDLNTAKMNVKIAREDFERLDVTGDGKKPARTRDSSSRAELDAGEEDAGRDTEY